MSAKLTSLENVIGQQVIAAVNHSTQFGADDGITLQFANGIVLCIGFSGDEGNITLNRCGMNEDCGKTLRKPGWYFDGVHEGELR